MNNNDIKQHISIEERNRWNKCVNDFNAHLGAGGANNHPLANRTVAGFSEANYTPDEQDKLAGIEAGALNNPHPATHSYEIITGLSVVGHTGSFSDLLNIPSSCYVAEKGNCDTVNGIKINIGDTAPENPINDKNIWIDTNTMLIKIYTNNAWKATCAVFG